MTIEAPRIAEGLRTNLEKVIEEKRLGDDDLWRSDIRPALIKRILDIRQLVEASIQSQLINILQSLDYIQNRLDHDFLQGAPFTIHRLAELILYFRESGYSLSTPHQVEKYVDALKKVVLVLSRESEFSTNFEEEDVDTKQNGVASSSTSIDYEANNLPPGVRFTEISWDATAKSQSDDMAEVPGAKSSQIHDGELDFSQDGEGGQSENMNFDGISPNKRQRFDDHDLPDGRPKLLSPLPDTRDGDSAIDDVG